MPPFKTLTITFLLFLLTSSQILAQNSLDSVNNNYKVEYTNYRNSQEAYLKSKAAYKSYQTVASKNDAFLKTKDYLKQVDSLYLSYFLLLGETLKSKEAKDNEPLKKEAANLIDSEIRFVKDHQNRVDSAKNLEELPPLAQELKQKLGTDGANISSLALSVVDYLETSLILSDFVNVSSQIQGEIDKREDASTSLFQNWKSELQILQNESQTQLDNARKAIDKRQLTGNKIDYEEILNYLEKVKAQMARASKLFEEIMKVI